MISQWLLKEIHRAGTRVHFFNLAPFHQNFTFIPMGVKNPSLGLQLGAVTYDAEAEVGGHGWRGW